MQHRTFLYLNSPEFQANSGGFQTGIQNGILPDSTKIEAPK